MSTTERDTEAAPPSRGHRLVVGLGNPGERYGASRHNLGFRVVDELVRRLAGAPPAVECNSQVAHRDDPDAPRLTLVKPQTYMNRSGWAVRCLVERHGFEPGEILVAYDDVHLPLGRLRLKPGGSPGGHRGLESVIENLRTDEVPRLRLGCLGEGGPEPGEPLTDYVLGSFEADEQERAEEMVRRAADASEAWWRAGAQAAMNRFNG